MPNATRTTTAIATLLGRRLGEMHAVLARAVRRSGLRPEAAGSDLTRAWAAQAEQQLAAAFNALTARQDWPEDAAQDLGRVMAIARPADRNRAATSRRTAPAARSPASTATCISARCWWPTATCSSSISRASRPSRWSSAAPRTARFATSPGCCARSTMRAAVVDRKSRESHAHLPQARAHRLPGSFVARATESFLAGYRTARRRRARSACRPGLARSVPAGEGRL